MRVPSPLAGWFSRPGVIALLVVSCGFFSRLASAAEEKWVKVTAEHFVVLTAASESAARARAVELEQFRRALQDVIPVPRDKLRPVTVVLFKNRRAMEPFLPLENGRPARLSGFFARIEDLNTIALTADSDPRETRRVIFHEAVHWQLSAYEGFFPVWLNEAVAELYSTFQLVDEKTYRFGDPIEDHVALLRGEKFLPLAELLETRPGSLLYNEGSRTSLFYAQSWALLHYLFHGEKSPGRASVGRYLASLRSGRSTAEAFREAFGADFATMEKTLRDYVEQGRYRALLFPRTTEDIARTLAAAPALPADVPLAKGSLLLSADRPAEAKPLLQHAADLAPQDPRAWELLGHIAVSASDYSAAQPFLSKAAAAGSTSYLVYHNLAVTHSPPGLFVADPDPDEMDKAAAFYRKAIALAPAHAESYRGLAGLMQFTKTFDPGDLTLLHRGAILAPTDARILVGIAIGEIRNGQPQAGRARLAELVAREDAGASAALTHARAMLDSELLKADLADIEAFARKQNYAEALAVIDRALARGLTVGARRAMEENRRQILTSQRIQEAVEAANRGDRVEARKLLESLLATSTHPATTMQVQRLLRDLTQAEERRRKK